MSSLPPDKLRPPCDEDAAAVADLASPFSPERVSPDRFPRAWTSRRTDRDRDARVGPGEYGWSYEKELQ